MCGLVPTGATCRIEWQRNTLLAKAKRQFGANTAAASEPRRAVAKWREARHAIAGTCAVNALSNLLRGNAVEFIRRRPLAHVIRVAAHVIDNANRAWALSVARFEGLLGTRVAVDRHE